MAVYRILVKKRIQLQAYHFYIWANTYMVVSATPYSSEERMTVADTVAPPPRDV